MTLPNGSASGAERLLACAASVVLPQTRSTSPYAERGHSLHRFVRNVLTGTPIERALELVEPQYRATATRIDWSQLGADLSDIRCETSYALDLRARSARYLGQDLQRAYVGITNDDLPGTLDVEGTRFDGVPVVGDLKFGWEIVDDPEHNAQMTVYALSRAWTTGASEVETRVWQVREDGRVWTRSYTFDAFALDAFADRLQDASETAKAMRVAAVQDGEVPTVRAGEHCRWCECISHCPEYITLARSMLSEAESLDQMTVAVAALSREQAGAAWQKAKRIDVVLERVFGALKMRARQENLPTSPGKVVRPVAIEKRSLNQTAAIGMLRDKGASDDEIAGLYVTTMAEQIRETNDPDAEKAPRARKRKAA